MRRALHAVWTAPRAPHPPGPLRRDWVLVGIVVVAALLEGFLRPEVVWRPLITVVIVAIAFTLPWRRVRPLAMLTIAFGSVLVLQLASLVVADGAVISLVSGAFVLILVYAVFRWGSGREALGAIGILLLVVVVGYGRDYHSLSELLLELAILTIPALVGFAVRAQTTARARDLEQVRLSEREQLARELHDTVAHHVSAMVVRAQAGRVVAASDPSAAVDALTVIEAEGSRTLAEMRILVGALRESDDPELLSPKVAADIASLAGAANGLTVEVSMAGPVDSLHPSVGTALYRIAQESVTNSRRHAVHASAVRIGLDVDAGTAHLTVVDDGERVHGERTGSGYGIVGMRERVALLGGTLTAGPGPDRGWLVDARVPTTGVSR